MRTCKESSKILNILNMVQPINVCFIPYSFCTKQNNLGVYCHIIYFTMAVPHWSMLVYLIRHCQVGVGAFNHLSQLQTSNNAELLQASFLLFLHLLFFLLYSFHDSCLPITEFASQAKWENTIFRNAFLDLSEYFLNKCLSLQCRAETMPQPGAVTSH